ncbi:DNA adenine methylase [Clostridium grantii]|uniref:Site-specific DNA-methyltransferase (adenine-specific) n=1 Tax=Clostridium grantii DSM 8605 TaxID=1121316 RepID=A0A1M5VH48_9CLOT|nr:DNA adenine methylase [Clostridium grantii]SHH74508.1 DNA adenine methylase [Clostridium grantii DSM 8605]
MNKRAKPFLKWAGGKTQLLEQLQENYPDKLKNGEVKKYIEPFIGGGAVFFSLVSQYNFEQVILNDINEEVILTYKVIQNNVEELIEYLLKVENEYLESEMEKKEEIFYGHREAFNKEKLEIDYENYSEQWISHAARMIMLNKTCFNGLYRLNRKGLYNVPFGKRKSVTICDFDNLRAVSEALEGVTFVTGDFENLTEYIDKGSFVYLDPPYRPLSNTASFTDYSKVSFNDESQIRLAEWTKLLDSRGALFMLSNSDPTNADENDKFFDDLYSDFTIDRVHASRMINSKGTGRGKVREILVKNY